MSEYFLKHNIGFDEYITGNRFIDICDNTSASFCKTDYISNFTNKRTNVLITHNSDYHINENRFKLGPQCNFWFAQNKDFEDDKIISIPIGIENMVLRTSPESRGGAWSSQINGAYEKALLINRINDMQFEKNLDVYMNFNLRTYPQERSYVWNHFQNEKWVTKTNNISIEQFYLDIASHKFVLSPRGNGVDCHRTWEALYLRTIPIVKKSTHMKQFEDLPIFFVDNWDEVCYNKLVDFYEKVKSSLYDLSKMKMSFWRQRINEKLSI